MVIFKTNQRILTKPTFVKVKIINTKNMFNKY